MQLSNLQLHLCLVDTINSASLKGNPWPTSQVWCTRSPHCIDLWQVHPSSCLGQMSCNHTYFPLSPSGNHISFLWKYTQKLITAHWLHFYHVGLGYHYLFHVLSHSFPIALPASTFAYTHSNVVSTSQPKNLWCFSNVSSAQNPAMVVNFSQSKSLCPYNDLQVSPFLASSYIYYLHSYNVPGLT